jgi:hypothetical protein
MSTKRLQDLMSFIITGAMTCSEVAFSAIGMTLLTTQKYLPYVAGASAGIIEYAVFAPNISKGLDILTTDDALLHRMIENFLQDKYADEANRENTFLKKYKEIFDEPESEEKQDKLRILRLYFFNQLLNMSSGKFDPVHIDGQLYTRIYEKFSTDSCEQNKISSFYREYLDSRIEEFVNAEEKSAFLKSFNKRSLIWALSSVFIILSALGTYFGMYAMIHGLIMMLLGAGVLAGTLAFLPHLIAGLAAAAFLLIMVKTVFDLIADNKLIKYFEKIKKCWQQASLAKKITMAILGVIFIGLLVGLGFATAGTFWACGLHGVSLLIAGVKSELLITLMTGVGLWISGVLLFSGMNMLHTYLAFVDKIVNFSCLHIKNTCSSKIIEYFINLYSQLFGSESRYQACNPIIKFLLFPFCVLAAIFKISSDLLVKSWGAVVLLVHCVSEGATVDNAFFIRPLFAMILRALQEFLADMPYIGGHSHEDTKHKIMHEDTHAHHHSPLPRLIFTVPTAIVFSPLFLLYACLTKQPSATFTQLVGDYVRGKSCKTHKQGLFNGLGHSHHGHACSGHDHAHARS